ncbi:MAG: hypothetical protein CL910_19530 [Deltaproteobacteria bacterium]|jgi:hypothetical protein|nr:hypothetical protein [Deltaproteobacteria bacterium]
MTTRLLLALLLLVPLRVSAEGWTLPRMAWGDPDLQGTWTSATITGLERMDGVDELVLTPEEARRIEEQFAGFFEAVDAVPEGELPAGEDVGGYNTFWMDPGKRMAIVRGEIRSSLLVEPADGKLPYSWRGRAQMFKRFYQFMKADDPEARLLGERCIVGFGSTGGPPMLPVLYNNHYRIVQSPGFLTILVEMNHDARIVRIGGEHLPAQIRPWLGDSVGHWEGDTLVVETTNFHPGQSFRGSLRHQIFMTKEARVEEKFTRVGEKEILYEFSVDDPGAYKQVWRGEVPLLAAEGRIYEYACHEGNYSLPGILAGARAED